MQMEISDHVHNTLVKQAQKHEMTVPAYLERIVQEHVQRAELRKQAVGNLLEFVKTNTATSGRGDLEWREYIHQGIF